MAAAASGERSDLLSVSPWNPAVGWQAEKGNANPGEALHAFINK